MSVRRLASLFLLIALAACEPGSQDFTPVDTNRILAADEEPGNWLSHGRDYGEQRFSPLGAIDRSNVARLGLAWEYEMRTPRGASATPIAVDGVMYVTSAWSVVYALDARTGEELWVWDPQVARGVGAKACCDVVNRGVAVYGDRVYVGVIDGRLVALDREDGSVAWETMTVDPEQPYTITGAPRAAKGLIYIGNGGAEYGVRGYVSAYDAESGALAWRFYTVPGNPAHGPDGAASDEVLERATETWTGSWWESGGGGTVWDAIVYDAEFDQLIIGVGNGSPWNRQIRSPGGGDNLFLSSIVALDAGTGAYRWHYQTTPGDTWDYTATQPIILAELTIDGMPRPVAMQLPKNGFFYVLDRSDGSLISGTPAVPMFPTAETPPGFPISWAWSIDEDGRPVENPEARFEGMTAVVRPSPFGVHNWHPMSYSPRSGLVYVPVHEIALDYTTDAAFEPAGGLWNTGVVQAPFPEDEEVRSMIRGGTAGYLVAWDPVAGREVWRAPRVGAWNGGTLATAGDLVFQGTLDGRFQALDALTGEILWDFDNQAATLSGPITFEVDGEQYVTVLGGFGSAFYLIAGALLPEPGRSVNSRVYTYRLGGDAHPTPIDVEPAPFPEPPTLRVSDADMGEGAREYARRCASCHGLGAISGGVLPDLRRSAALQSADEWRQIVLEGRRSELGMPAMSGVLDERTAELTRAYVARQATLRLRSAQDGPTP